jgi:plasmid stabilization system protein ParE
MSRPDSSHRLATVVPDLQQLSVDRPPALRRGGSTLGKELAPRPGCAKSLQPNGPATRERAELSLGIRRAFISDMHVSPAVKVRTPAHVLFYRVVKPGLVEIVRVLHERMEPSRYLGAKPED